MEININLLTLNKYYKILDLKFYRTSDSEDNDTDEESKD